MLHVTTAAGVEDLASELAEVLGRPLDDPMAPEWVVVVSAGMRRWLRLELSCHLGVTGPGSVDGIAANLDLIYPGRLTRRLLQPGVERSGDPWDLERVVWAVLDVLDAGGVGDRDLGPLARSAPGATRWGRARRLADLFDHYLLHRPAMVRSWSQGRDVDGLGHRIPARFAWQPRLWRAVRQRIGTPSPAELLPDRLADLRAGACPAEVPERVCLFGLTTIPGGAPFLDLLDALATQRDVYLLAHQASPALAEHVHQRVAASPESAATPGRSPATDDARHPLLRSWARPAREAVALLGPRLDPAAIPTPPAGPEPRTLLGALQADLRADRAPVGDHVPAATDRSIVVHECHGASRQVEVLRDQILHLLADDPSLSEDDIVVLCPALDDMAPLIEAVLGPPVPRGGEPPEAGEDPVPALSYRITDRSLGSASPLLSALGAVLELVASRVSDAAVADLVALGPVRRRFDFTDEDLDTLAVWIEQANTRWGLDARHRTRWGLPDGVEDATWRAAIDQLLLGVAVGDDPSALAIGGVAPIAVEGDGVALAGRFADLLARLDDLVVEVATPRPATAWVDLLRRIADELLAVDPAERWQRQRLDDLLGAIADAAVVDGAPCQVRLDLADVRHLVGRQLATVAGRGDFFRGGITFSSLTPLRGLPHRVVCLLGMDEAAFASGAPDGDDLSAADPHLGDRDRRADERQGLLETILATRDHLVVVRSGHSVVTNQPIPPATPVAELVDAVVATVDPSVRDDVRGRLCVVHPRQGFDERNFLSGTSSLTGSAGDDPWSFDAQARDGALARARRTGPARLVEAPLERPPEPVIDLADLRDLVAHPPRHLLRQVLDVRLPASPERHGGRPVAAAPSASGLRRAADGRDLDLSLDGLDRWGLRDRLLAHRRAGGDLDSFARRERAGGRLPPGRLAEAALDDADGVVSPLVGRLGQLGALDATPEPRSVDVVLPGGVRLVGTVVDGGADRPGPVLASVSAPSPQRLLGPWVDLLALVADDPSTPWAAVLVQRPPQATKKGYREEVIEIPSTEATVRRDRAMAALVVLADLYRRGRVEPLPVFPATSPALAAGKGARRAWEGGWGQGGDANDRWVRQAFGRVSFDEITSIPVRDDDPDGIGGDRATRYANVLWGAVEASRAPDDAEDLS